MPAHLFAGSCYVQHVDAREQRLNDVACQEDGEELQEGVAMGDQAAQGKTHSAK